jgi:hypothetical protein
MRLALKKLALLVEIASVDNFLKKLLTKNHPFEWFFVII